MREDIKYLIKNGKYEQAIRKLYGEEHLKLSKEKMKKMVEAYEYTPKGVEDFFKPNVALNKIIENHPVDPNKKKDIMRVKDWPAKREFWRDILEDSIQGDDYDVEIKPITKENDYEVIFYTPKLKIDNMKPFRTAIKFADEIMIYPHMWGVVIMSVVYRKDDDNNDFFV